MKVIDLGIIGIADLNRDAASSMEILQLHCVAMLDIISRNKGDSPPCLSGDNCGEVRRFHVA
jgi:hypothetical protein